MASPNLTIRPAKASDMPAVGHLGALLVQTHHDFDAKRFLPATPRTDQGYGSYLGSQLAKPDVVVLVAERDGAVVGYTYSAIEGTDYMALRGPAGALYDIIVDPAHRGSGIGRALLDATVAELARRGAPRVVLSTAWKNDVAHRLFEGAGFRRTMLELTRETEGEGGSS